MCYGQYHHELIKQILKVHIFIIVSRHAHLEVYFSAKVISKREKDRVISNGPCVPGC